MSVARRQVPAQCSLLVSAANHAYWDCYEAPLARTDLSMQQLCLAVFAHHPMWMKRLLVLRTKLVAPFGIGGLRAILPFHRLGVRKLLQNAAAAGRI